MIVHRYAELSQVRMHYLEAGSGSDVVLLLHGWPHTSHAWRHVIPKIEGRHRVLAPDMRGLGDSSRPATGYDIKSVAGDIIELLDALAIERFSIVGHDWGGPVAFAVCLLAPLRVKRFAVIDVVLPGDGRAAGGNQGGLRWHHAFHRTPDLPEALTAGRESAYLNWFYQEYSERAGAVGADDLAEYVRTYSQPGAMRAGFEYYRSVEQSNAFASHMITKHGKLRIPTLTVSGGAGRGRGAEVAESVSRVAEKVTSHIVPDCGHLVPEEAPDELSNLLVPFLGDRQ